MDILLTLIIASSDLSIIIQATEGVRIRRRVAEGTLGVWNRMQSTTDCWTKSTISSGGTNIHRYDFAVETVKDFQKRRSSF